jgi:FAD-dependent urate hydroxylase
MSRLLSLEKKLAHDLEMLNYPQADWIIGSKNRYDVAIIGGGMAGLAAAFELKKMGINNIIIYDKNPSGNEGSWATYARMQILRSTKELVGPALDLPDLTFRAWYEAQWGFSKWLKLGKIPTAQWMDYLRWFRRVLDLPVENNRNLLAIVPESNLLALHIDSEVVTVGKVILATGRGGFGGSIIPSFVNTLPTDVYAHTNSPIDFQSFNHKKIAIIGAGASGFDAAAVALESGAAQVDIIVRRPHLPVINKAASVTYSGFSEGYYRLSDVERWSMMVLCHGQGVPPPLEALERLKAKHHFAVKLNTHVEKAEWRDNHVYLKTDKGNFEYDFLILATGFAIDVCKEKELSSIKDKILLWKDRPGIKYLQGPVSFYQSPYLGPHFQFLEKQQGAAPYLKDIYCFNYAATLSHGLLSGDIPGIGLGATHLAKGVAGDFFAQQLGLYKAQLKDYQIHELEESRYPFFMR